LIKKGYRDEKKNRPAIGGRMFKRFLRVLLVFLLAIGGLSLSGCIHFGNSGPSAVVDSYNEVKRELVDLPGVIFLDISTYDEDEFEFSVCQFPPSGKPKTGYLLQASTGGATRLERAGADSAFSYFSLLCDNEELSYRWVDSSPAITANTVYRGIPMEKYLYDDTEQYERELAAHDDSYLYPKGTQVFRFSYEFSLNGYLYIMIAILTISPEQAEAPDSEAEMAAAEAELRGLIDDILNQGGIPR
jgi:hypothetical protein